MLFGLDDVIGASFTSGVLFIGGVRGGVPVIVLNSVDSSSVIRLITLVLFYG